MCTSKIVNPKKSDITTPKQRPKKANPIGNKICGQIKKNSHNTKANNQKILITGMKSNQASQKKLFTINILIH